MSKKSHDDAPRVLVEIPFTLWMNFEFEAEIDRSTWREAAVRADEEVSTHGDLALDCDALQAIILDMLDVDALKEAAMPDFVEGVGRALVRRYRRAFKLVPKDLGRGDPLVSMPEALAVMLLEHSASNDHQYLADMFEQEDMAELVAQPLAEWHPSVVWALIESRLDVEEFQQEVLDFVACFTDALCCDRLFDEKDFAARAATLRSRKAAISLIPGLSTSESIH